MSSVARVVFASRLRLQEAGAERGERRATWTELFFDLVFVVAVAQLASGLHEHLSAGGAVAFVGLFVPVWWTWTTYAYAADLFDADEAAFRAVLLGAMLLIAGLAATVPAAFEGRTAGFVLAYAVLRAVAAGLWWMYFARFDAAVFDWALASGSARSSSATATWRCSPD